MPPRVRFAPSPTGYLHVGGARTALFNWLFAKRHGGAFVLRIEDTDTERSSDEMVSGILESLRWLGLMWDEGPEVGGSHGPYFQTQRYARHREIAERLLTEGHAYRCYCSAELLKEKREQAERQGLGWKYDRACLALTADQRAKLDADGVPAALRFKVPAGRTTYDDRVRGTITFDHDQIEDFVVLRSSGLPTYHLSVVADDLDMRITHVIRGDDHISNTPKHILLWQALGATPPEFAHVPLLLGTDKKRLSKRHGATSVTEYERLGYLPDAMVNFLGLLGWSPGDDREVMSRQELIEAFTLDGISGGDAVFNPEKLDWFNMQYLARMTPVALTASAKPLFAAAGLWRPEFEGDRREWLENVVQLVLPRVRRLPDFVEQAGPFLSDRVDYDPEAVRKHLTTAGLDGHIESLANAFINTEPWDAQTIERVLREVADEQRIKAAMLIHASRIATTGKAVSPGIFEVLALMGKRVTVTRLQSLVTYLRTS